MCAWKISAISPQEIKDDCFRKDQRHASGFGRPITMPHDSGPGLAQTLSGFLEAPETTCCWREEKGKDEAMIGQASEEGAEVKEIDLEQLTE